ncbi:MAG: type I glutamate--ammonia ligase [Fimbriimonadaceae bacterium]|nr:type I glutamate--ammonia ligase [Fimbriimonadaceae bacterium]
MATPKDVLKLIVDEDVEFVDVRFTDLPGLQQHFSLPADQFGEGEFADGLGFDGSSIRGFQEIQESDMLLIPDPDTVFIDPFFEHKTLVILANVEDPITRQKYSRDPRYVAQKAEAYLQSTGIAETCYFGPEAEFFIFDGMRYSIDPWKTGYEIVSREAPWTAGDAMVANTEELSFGYKIRTKEGYFPVPPNDQLQDVRSQMVQNMREIGLEVEVHHHEVASAGQAEIDLRFAPLTKMADDLLAYKYIVKNTARQFGMCATFMPKPLYADNGTGMHCHQSLWKGGVNLFWDPNGAYSNLSKEAMYYIGGILKHAPALLAFTNPTTNSYKRLVPGYEAPIMLAYSQRNRSAAVRIPMYAPTNPKAKRLEFRSPDPTCNPYLAFAAMLMAGLDGIQNQIDPGQPLDKNIYDLPAEERANVPTLPTSLDKVLKNLEEDHEWLLKGGVFTEDLIETYIDYKIENEFYEVNNRPHPMEFFLYFDL